MIFTTPHILLTAVITAVGAYAVLHFAATEMRPRDRAITALIAGVLTFMLRFLGNVPALNDDFAPAVSIDDVLGFSVAALAGIAYWAVWPSDRPRPLAAHAVRWWLLLGVVGFVVNVVVI
jgi:heme A synthase